MIFVCCAIKLLRSTFQLPSLALSLSTPWEGWNQFTAPRSALAPGSLTSWAELPVLLSCSPSVCKVASIPKQAGNDGLVPRTATLFPTASQFQQFHVLRAVTAACTRCISSGETHILLSTSAPHSLEAFSPFLSCTLYSQTSFSSTPCCTGATPEPCPVSEPCEAAGSGTGPAEGNEAVTDTQTGIFVSARNFCLICALSHCSSPVPPWHFHNHVPWLSKEQGTGDKGDTEGGGEQPANRGKVAHSKQSWQFCKADTSSANAQADCPIHLKGFIRRRQETLVSRMENLEQFCPVWGDNSTSNTDFCRVPHICASSLELLPDSHPG